MLTNTRCQTPSFSETTYIPDTLKLLIGKQSIFGSSRVNCRCQKGCAAVDGKQIRVISAEGLTYLTENGCEIYIDFSMCYKNYLRETTDPNYIEDMKRLNPFSQWDDEGIDAYIRKRVAWREVALRNIVGTPWGDGRPYLEFHTDPPTRFVFATEDEYYSVRQIIEGRFGWRTFDMS